MDTRREHMLIIARAHEPKAAQKTVACVWQRLKAVVEAVVASRRNPSGARQLCMQGSARGQT